jgi:hypothetical protein
VQTKDVEMTGGIHAKETTGRQTTKVRQKQILAKSLVGAFGRSSSERNNCLELNSLKNTADLSAVLKEVRGETRVAVVSDDEHGEETYTRVKELVLRSYLLNQINDESTLKRAVKSEGDYHKLFEKMLRLH